MGIIKTKGKAEHKYECDIMTVTIRFQERGADSSVISKSVMDSCERFISELLKFSKLTVKDIHIDEDDVTEQRYSNEASSFAKRTLCIQTAFDMKLINMIREQLNEGGYQHNILVQYDYSKVNELHAEVVKEALLEAKNQAEIIADSLGLELECLEKAEEQGGRHTEFKECECERGIVDYSRYSFSDELAGKVKSMAVEVHAEWRVK